MSRSGKISCLPYKTVSSVAMPISISRHSSCLLCQWWRPTISSSLFWWQTLLGCQKHAQLLLGTFLTQASALVYHIRYIWAPLNTASLQGEWTGRPTDFFFVTEASISRDESSFRLWSKRCGSAPVWTMTTVNGVDFKLTPCSGII